MEMQLVKTLFQGRQQMYALPPGKPGGIASGYFLGYHDAVCTSQRCGAIDDGMKALPEYASLTDRAPCLHAVGLAWVDPMKAVPPGPLEGSAPGECSVAPFFMQYDPLAKEWKLSDLLMDHWHAMAKEWPHHASVDAHGAAVRCVRLAAVQAFLVEIALPPVAKVLIGGAAVNAPAHLRLFTHLPKAWGVGRLPGDFSYFSPTPPPAARPPPAGPPPPAGAPPPAAPPPPAAGGGPSVEEVADSPPPRRHGDPDAAPSLQTPLHCDLTAEFVKKEWGAGPCHNCGRAYYKHDQEVIALGKLSSRASSAAAAVSPARAPRADDDYLAEAVAKAGATSKAGSGNAHREAFLLDVTRRQPPRESVLTRHADVCRAVVPGWHEPCSAPLLQLKEEAVLAVEFVNELFAPFLGEWHPAPVMHVLVKAIDDRMADLAAGKKTEKLKAYVTEVGGQHGLSAVAQRILTDWGVRLMPATGALTGMEQLRTADLVADAVRAWYGAFKFKAENYDRGLVPTGHSRPALSIPPPRHMIVVRDGRLEKVTVGWSTS